MTDYIQFMDLLVLVYVQLHGVNEAHGHTAETFTYGRPVYVVYMRGVMMRRDADVRDVRGLPGDATTLRRFAGCFLARVSRHVSRTFCDVSRARVRESEIRKINCTIVRTRSRV